MADFIRHFSSVRYALVSFLFAVGLAAFSGYFSLYFQTMTKPSFLIVAGHVVMVGALVASLRFSWETERAHLYLTLVWDWLRGEGNGEPPGWKSFGKSQKNENQEKQKEISKNMAKNMVKDWLNWLLVIGVGVILGFFWYFSCKLS